MESIEIQTEFCREICFLCSGVDVCILQLEGLVEFYNAIVCQILSTYCLLSEVIDENFLAIYGILVFTVIIIGLDRSADSTILLNDVKGNVSVDDILSLMDFFGMPFKAVVLRLYESQNITKQTAYGLLSVSAEEIRHRISLTGKAKRWMLDGHGQESFGTLEVKMDFNCQNELLTESRRDDDLTYLADLKKQLGIE